MQKKRISRMLLVFFMMYAGFAAAQEYDSHQAKAWLGGFASALGQLPPLGDAVGTEDPARAGQYLLEYAFGTVMALVPNAPLQEDILQIDVRTQQVTDCRGKQVGMSLEEILDGRSIPQTREALTVLDISKTELGWCWAYLDGKGSIYGVEWVAYDLTNADAAKEYTLTYLFDANGTVGAIRFKAADSTQAQARSGYATVEEMLKKTDKLFRIEPNAAAMFNTADIDGLGAAALGTATDELVAYLGEPVQLQTLPGGGGRILVYEGAAVHVALEEKTGVEMIRALTVAGTGVLGPRGLAIGMDAEEAASLFRCDYFVDAQGGALYVEGEAMGEAPCGEMMAVAPDEAQLRYVCMNEKGETVMLETGIQDGKVAYWRLGVRDEEETQDGN